MSKLFEFQRELKKKSLPEGRYGQFLPILAPEPRGTPHFVNAIMSWNRFPFLEDK